MSVSRPSLTERTIILEQRIETQEKHIEQLIKEVRANTEEMRKMSVTYSRVNTLFSWVGKVMTAVLIGWAVWLIKTKA